MTAPRLRTPQWSTSTSDPCVLDPHEHADIVTSLVKRAAQHAPRGEIDRVISDMLAPILADVWRAGHRHGRAEAQAKLADVVRERVARAVAGIAIEPGPCPHCAARGCDACAQTGNWQERFRTR